MSKELRDLFEKLTYDSYRDNNAFSENINFIHDNIFEPRRSENIWGFVRREDIAEALRFWIQGRGSSYNQPCVFGSIAAAQSGAGPSHLHFAVITHDDLLKRSDEEIAEMIHADRLDWKRRSLMWGSETSTPAHGFILAVVSPRLAYAGERSIAIGSRSDP